MSPAILGLLALVGVGAYALSQRKRREPEIDRATAMQRMADVFYRVINKDPKEPVAPGELEEAVNIAQNIFGLYKTVQGIRSGKGLPNDEKWPGTDASVAAYMYEYTKQRKGAPKPKTYNDPAPVPPYQDPRPIRAAAIAAETSNPAQAKLLHAKADVLSKLIRAKTTTQKTVQKGKDVLAAAKGLFSVKK